MPLVKVSLSEVCEFDKNASLYQALLEVEIFLHIKGIRHALLYTPLRAAVVVCCLISICNHTVSSSIWKLICTSEFFKKLKLHEPLLLVQFQIFKNFTSANQFQIERENPEWLLINNINMKTFAWTKSRMIFLDAIFSHSIRLVSAHNFCNRFTWYHWLRKLPIVFQQIIIQIYDM